MKLNIREMRDDYGLLEFEEVNYSFLNSLRRSMITMVPCLGIHEVDFHMGTLGSWTDEEGEEREYESISAMFNEILAHRLGMLPVPTDADTIVAFGDAVNDPEKQPEIMYSLHKQGPCTVYSGDLEPVNGDKSLAIPDPNVPIVKLGEGQAILVYARAIIGTGAKHAKWQAVVAPRFYEAQTVKISGSRAAELVKAAGTGGFKKSGKAQILKDPAKAYQAIRNLRRYHDDPKAEEAIEVETLTDHYLFEFETNGAVSAKLALEQALKALNSHCTEFVAGLEAAA
jgi:DNA-directed RNA polymerase subunit D